MSRFRSIVLRAMAALPLALLAGCGSSVPPTPGFGVPAVIKLAPTPTASMDLGTTLQFSASALNGTKAPLTATFSYSSSNPGVVSIANTGLACAGTWDNLTTPVVCTPGGAGQATITASSSGVVSAPTTVYVHQPIAVITVTPIPSNGGPPQGPFSCYTTATGSVTTAQVQSYQAQALSDDATGQPTLDITSSVGPFTWSASEPLVATLTPLNALGIPNGQLQATAHTPGLTEISASIANTTSAPVSFLACPVQSIQLAVSGTSDTTIAAAKGSRSIVTATITVISGNPITPSLTWSSSNQAVATVSNGAISGSGVGGTTITASCIAPTCNINLSPPQSIYAAPLSSNSTQQTGGVISATYSGTTSTPFSVYVASSSPECTTNVRCTAFLVAISGSPPLAGSGAALPNRGGSIRFAPAGATAYVGSETGLMTVSASANPPTVTADPAVTGDVLAVSPDGKKVIVSDTRSPVNQVFILDTASNTSTNFAIAGATAAAFSPDSLKAYVAAGSTLYVYSTQSAFEAIPLPGPATDVSFLANGMFGYVAEASGEVSYLAVCDDPTQPVSARLKSAPAQLSMIRALPDGSGFVGLAPPNLILLNTSINGLPLPMGVLGCPTPLGGISVSNSVSTVSLSATAFTPIAFLLSSDGQKVYVVVQGSPTIIVYDLISQLPPSSLSLAGNPNPLSAALAPDDQTLYVSADDGKVHFINTVSGGDAYQLDVPSSSLCTIASGGQQPTCLPDVLAVRP